MADPANIEAIQEAKAQEARRETRRLAVQRLLREFDPQPGDMTMDYTRLLQRAQTVIAIALEQEGDT
jgi:hypothetical protein